MSRKSCLIILIDSLQQIILTIARFSVLCSCFFGFLVLDGFDTPLCCACSLARLCTILDSHHHRRHNTPLRHGYRIPPPQSQVHVIYAPKIVTEKTRGHPKPLPLYLKIPCRYKNFLRPTTQQAT